MQVVSSKITSQTQKKYTKISNKELALKKQIKNNCDYSHSSEFTAVLDFRRNRSMQAVSMQSPLPKIRTKTQSNQKHKLKNTH